MDLTDFSLLLDVLYATEWGGWYEILCFYVKTELLRKSKQSGI